MVINLRAFPTSSMCQGNICRNKNAITFIHLRIIFLRYHQNMAINLKAFPKSSICWKNIETNYKYLLKSQVGNERIIIHDL